jgi:hypothetical protein
VTEQVIITTPSETTASSSAERKATTKSKPPTKKALDQTARKSTQKASSLTDEQKRLARNAALREWRKKNAARVKAYMTQWREKRKGEHPAVAASPGSNAPARAAAKKKSTSKAKKVGKA